jgi:small GTP-binding protein
MKCLKIVLLGDSFVGKTSIVRSFFGDHFNEGLNVTVSPNQSTKILTLPTTGKKIKLLVWDTAGQERYRSMAKAYYQDADAAILVYDVTSQTSFDILSYWIKEMKTNASNKVMLTIVGNKCDLIEREEVDIKNAKKYADQNQADFSLASAKTGVGVRDIFLNICKKSVASSDEMAEKAKTKVR